MEKVEEKKYQIVTKLTEKELNKLQFLLENKKIEDLEIYRFNLQDFDKETLKKLEDYNHLKRAYFKINQENCIPFLLKLIRGNKFENLTLDLPKSKDTLLIFQALKENKFIEHLYIYQRLEKDLLKSVQKLLTENTNLKSFDFQNFENLHIEDIDLSGIITGIQDNSSIEYLSLNPINMKQKEVLNFNKFKALETLKLKFIREITIDEEDEYTENQPIILETPLNFSKLSIKKFDFSSSRIDNRDMIYLMKSLKDVALFEELNLGYSTISHKNSKDDFSKWLTDLKEILVNNKNLKKLNISNMSLIDKDFEILCEGFEKNDTLTSLDIEGNNLGKCATQIGKILKSKVNLEDLYIGDDTFKFNDFMKEFQFQENLVFFFLSKCKLDNESDELISNFLLNNRNINVLSLYIESMETLKNLFQALNSHKKIKDITIDSLSSIPGIFITNLVKNNFNFEYVSFSNVIFEEKELKECFEALSKDLTLKIFKITSLNDLSSSNIMKMIEEYLIYNYSLIDFNIEEEKSIYCERNKEFITNYYKIKNLKLYDLFYTFK